MPLLNRANFSLSLELKRRHFYMFLGHFESYCQYLQVASNSPNGNGKGTIPFIHDISKLTDQTSDVARKHLGWMHFDILSNYIDNLVEELICLFLASNKKNRDKCYHTFQEVFYPYYVYPIFSPAPTNNSPHSVNVSNSRSNSYSKNKPVLDMSAIDYVVPPVETLWNTLVDRMEIKLEKFRALRGKAPPSTQLKFLEWDVILHPCYLEDMYDMLTLKRMAVFNANDKLKRQIVECSEHLKRENKASVRLNATNELANIDDAMGFLARSTQRLAIDQAYIEYTHKQFMKDCVKSKQISPKKTSYGIFTKSAKLSFATPTTDMSVSSVSSRPTNNSPPRYHKETRKVARKKISFNKHVSVIAVDESAPPDRSCTRVCVPSKIELLLIRGARELPNCC